MEDLKIPEPQEARRPCQAKEEKVLRELQIKKNEMRNSESS
ncbi:hypothetical protein [Desulfitispora alkaliphila]